MGIFKNTGKRLDDADPRLLLVVASAFMVAGVFAPHTEITVLLWLAGVSTTAVAYINKLEDAEDELTETAEMVEVCKPDE